MGEFDLTLINEFRSCPSFYDRSNPRFKDKTFNAHHWQEISNKLGFDVSILKDRILQLRNRYNLEKRRLEQLREENPGKNFDSPWPLYDHLYFLSQHIRSRRSYRKLLPLNTHQDKGGDDDDDDDEDYVGGGGGTASRKDHSRQNTFQNEYYNAVAARTEAAPAATASEDSQREQQSMVQFPNGLLTVKMEDDSEESAANETDSHINEPHAYIVNRSIPHSMPQKLKLKKQNPSSPPHIPTITIRRFETMRSQEKQNRQNAAIAAAAAAAVAPPPPSRISKRRFATENAAQQQQQQPPAKVRTPCSTPQPQTQQHTPLGPPQTTQQQYQQQQQQLAPAATAHLAPPPAPPAHLPDTNQTHDIFTKYARLSPRELKYAAFGQFISSSLLDLPMSTALELVEKFTSEIVRTLKEKQQDNSASSFNGFDENEQ